MIYPDLKHTFLLTYEKEKGIVSRGVRVKGLTMIHLTSSILIVTLLFSSNQKRKTWPNGMLVVVFIRQHCIQFILFLIFLILTGKHQFST